MNIHLLSSSSDIASSKRKGTHDIYSRTADYMADYGVSRNSYTGSLIYTVWYDFDFV
jgi:hypothetical protein